MSFKRIALCLSVFLLLLSACQGFCQAPATKEKIMDRAQKAAQTRHSWGAADTLRTTDPGLAAIRDNLLYGQILDQGTLTGKQQALVILASLTAAQNFNELAQCLESALQKQASPEEIKETLYQCAPYVGFPRVVQALDLANAVFKKHGISLPLADQAAVTEESRFEKGLSTQKGIFGAENIEGMQKKAPAGQQAIVTDYLSAYCFGDFYTRKTLDLKMRELITFSVIVSLGGCDPQAKSHAGANIKVGNSKQNLVDALAAMLPFIGFPRTLNGLAAVNAAVPE